MSGPPIHSRSEIPRPDAENTRRTRYSVFRRTIINGIDLADQKKERNRQPPPRIYFSGRDNLFYVRFQGRRTNPAIVAPTKFLDCERWLCL
jgi:hypothetical protein